MIAKVKIQSRSRVLVAALLVILGIGFAHGITGPIPTGNLTYEFINGGAFAGCSSLGQLTLPGGLTVIERYAFWNCTGLTEIEIPDGLTSIAASSFAGCRSLIGFNVVSNPNFSTNGGASQWQWHRDCALPRWLGWQLHGSCWCHGDHCGRFPGLCRRHLSHFFRLARIDRILRVRILQLPRRDRSPGIGR